MMIVITGTNKNKEFFSPHRVTPEKPQVSQSTRAK
jgi:hypothetical protein